MDRLDAMQVLLAVVDAGSLSAASRALNTPLPNVSRRVAELEQRLGTTLLIRTHRNIQLTDAGRDYVDAIRPVVEQLEAAERRAAGEYSAPRGELRLTTSIEFGRLVMMPLLMPFLDEYPQITVNIVSVDGTLQLVEDHIDVAVRIGPLADSGLFAVKVGDVSPLTCASPAYLERRGRPERPEDLAAHDGALFGKLNEGWWKYRVAGETIEAKPQPRLRGNTAAASITAALAGIGITRALDFQVAEHLRSGALVRILEDYEVAPFPVHLLYVRQGLLPLKLRAFLDWVTPRLRERLRELADLP
ncbi:MAG: LysR family transcriptional regulator [Sphingopyxis sp.]|nr:LysR family transcriptional regulator [Sphingopyxis sp.]